MKQGSLIIFLVYAVFGLYFITSSLNIVQFPDFVYTADKWIRLVGGIFIIVGGLNYLRINSWSKRRRY